MQIAATASAIVLLWALSSGAEEQTCTGGRRVGGEGVRPAKLEDLIRPLDDSDPEMRDHVERIHTGGGCPTMPHRRCAEASQPWADGGDRLARYLIHQIEASEAEGYPRRAHDLNLVAHTRSETGFVYLRDLVAQRETLGSFGMFAIKALSKTRDERALDEMLKILEEGGPGSPQRSAAIRGLVRLLEDTGSRRGDAVAALRVLQRDPKASDYVTRSMISLGID